MTSDPIASRNPRIKIKNEFLVAFKLIMLSSSSSNRGSFSPVVILNTMLKMILIMMWAMMDTKIKLKTKDPQKRKVSGDSSPFPGRCGYMYKQKDPKITMTLIKDTMLFFS